MFLTAGKEEWTELGLRKFGEGARREKDLFESESIECLQENDRILLEGGTISPAEHHDKGLRTLVFIQILS